MMLVPDTGLDAMVREELTSIPRSSRAQGRYRQGLATAIGAFIHDLSIPLLDHDRGLDVAPAVRMLSHFRDRCGRSNLLQGRSLLASGRDMFVVGSWRRRDRYVIGDWVTRLMDVRNALNHSEGLRHAESPTRSLCGGTAKPHSARGDQLTRAWGGFAMALTRFDTPL